MTRFGVFPKGWHVQRALLSVFALFLSVGASGCLVRLSRPGGLAEVNGIRIGEAEMEEKLTKLHYKPTVGEIQAQEMPGKGLDALLDGLIEDALMYQEAVRLGLDEDPVYQDKVERYLVAESVRQLRKKEVLSKIPRDEDHVREYAERNYRRIRARALVSADRPWIEERAAEIAGGESFDAVVEAVTSDGGTAKLLNFPLVARKAFPAGVADKLFSTEPGSVCGPLPYGPGWALFYVEEIQDLDDAYYERNKKVIERSYERDQEVEIGNRLVERYRARAEIQIDRALLEGSDEDEEGGEQGEKPIAWVNGEPIRWDAYVQARKKIESRKRMRVHPDKGEAGKGTGEEALERLIRIKLVEQEALRRRYEKTDAEFKERFERYKRRVLVDLFKRRILSEGVKVDEEEIQEYYEQNKDRFRPAPRVQFLLVVFFEEQAANDFRSEVSEGADFGRLVEFYEQKGECKTMVHPWRSLDRLSPGIKEVVQALGVGEVSPVLRLGTSYQIVKLVGRSEEGVPPLSEIHEKIRMEIGQKKYTEFKEAYLSKLKATARIRVNEAGLEALKRKLGLSSNKGTGKD